MSTVLQIWMPNLTFQSNFLLYQKSPYFIKDPSLTIWWLNYTKLCRKYSEILGNWYIPFTFQHFNQYDIHSVTDLDLSKINYNRQYKYKKIKETYNNNEMFLKPWIRYSIPEVIKKMNTLYPGFVTAHHWGSGCQVMTDCIQHYLMSNVVFFQFVASCIIYYYYQWLTA